MARDLPRTPTDDTLDAMRALTELYRELPHVRSHLVRSITEPAHLHQARTSARIVAGIAETIARIAGEGAHRAEVAAAADGDTELRPVS